MVTVCPCGCGRKVDRSVEKAVVGVVRVDAMLAVAKPLLRPGPGEQRWSAPTATDLRRALADGEQLRGWFVEHVHRDTLPGITPDLPTLSRRLDEFASTIGDVLTAVPA